MSVDPIRTFRALSGAAGLFLVAACSGPRAQAPGPAAPAGFTWVHTELAEHPLVGRIVRVSDGAFVTESDLAAAVLGSDVAILGERHDNQDHHRLQARLVGSVVMQKRDIAIAMEMFEEGSQTKVDAGLAAVRAKKRRAFDDDVPLSEAFAKVVKWDENGWGPVSGYAPLLDVVFASELQIVAANLDNLTVRGIAHHGESALDQENVKKLGLDEAVPAPIQRELEADMMEAHCNKLPASMVPNMALAQRARDTAMAAHVADRPTVLIAGAGHARNDRGVPAVLKKRHPTLKVVSVALLEVEPNKRAATDYPNAFDYRWFTPRRSLEDDCTLMQEKRPKKAPSAAQGR